MAQNIVSQVLGGNKRVLDNVHTVGDVKQAMGATNHTASINGEPARDSDTLADGDFVSLSQAVKGGLHPNCSCLPCALSRHKQWK
jgi:hypothetical protein